MVLVLKPCMMLAIELRSKQQGRLEKANGGPKEESRDGSHNLETTLEFKYQYLDLFISKLTLEMGARVRQVAPWLASLIALAGDPEFSSQLTHGGSQTCNSSLVELTLSSDRLLF